MAVHTRMGYN